MEPYCTKHNEHPAPAITALFRRHPNQKIVLIGMIDQVTNSRVLLARPVGDPNTYEIDSIVITAGDNAVFVATAIGLTYTHNLTVENTTKLID